MILSESQLSKLYTQFLNGEQMNIDMYIVKQAPLEYINVDIAISKPIIEQEEDVDLFLDEEDALSTEELDDILTELGSSFKNGRNIYTGVGADFKYIVLSDIHIPFHRKKVLEAIEKNYGNKGFRLILLGDILDCHDISTFPKAFSVGFKQEIAIFKEYLTRWSKLFDHIFIISGNHEARLPMYLRKRVAAEVVEMLPDDLIEYAIKDIKAKNISYQPGDTINWWMQLDNVLLCHPRGNCPSGILGTARKVQEFFTVRGLNVNTFICGHTHKMGQALNNGAMLIESGCLCLPQEYAMDGKVAYSPEAGGFVTFTSRNGVIGHNDIKLHYIG